MSVCGLYVSHVEEGEGVLEGEIIQVELCGRIEVAGGEAGRGGICNVCKSNDGGVRSPWIIVVNK